MKRFVFALIVIILLFTACKAQTPNVGSTTDKSLEITETTIQTSRTTIWRTNPDTGLQEHVPGNVIIDPGSEYDQGFKVSYRQIYYTVPLSYMDFLGIDQGEAGTLLQARGENRNWEEPHEMDLVFLLKKFNVPKEKFIELVKKEEERAKQFAVSGTDVDTEEFEIPNPDIIYTFDNDVINEFYRRE